MNFYLAPMEGVSGYIYRNAYHQQFHPMDKYFTPFLVPNQNRVFKTRERQDVLPEHNQGMVTIPQLLTNSAEDFIWAATELQMMGYQEVNLNLGCPSGTVVAKHKGAGFLAVPEKLDRFFDSVFPALTMAISVKTRTGVEGHQEFKELLRIFNRYPLKELIIHPRTRNDMYRNKPNLEVFGEALVMSSNPICYNGDICTPKDYERLCTSFPRLEAVMLGRGVLADPGLTELLCKQQGIEKQQMRQFHDRLCSGYAGVLSGERNVLFKMKELWDHMGTIFADSSKHLKKIKKAQQMKEYMMAVDLLFEERDITARVDRKDLTE